MNLCPTVPLVQYLISGCNDEDIPVAPRIPTLISCLVAGIVYSMKEKV